MRGLCAAALAASWIVAAPLGALAQEAGAPAAAVPGADASAIAAQPSEAEMAAAAQSFYDSLDKQTGAINLVGGKVVLTVPETHYFIGAEDARRVIVDVWGNPPQAATGVEGMLLEAGSNPALGAWGAVVEYSDDGHVDDSDAATIDYSKLLEDMQQSTQQENEQRRAAGYDEITLTGWAEPPHYDSSAKTLYWAKLLTSSAGYESLNYDIRVLGREGVLVMSFIADPSELETIRASAPAVLTMPAFTEGNRYADYQEGVDRKAAYGIGGLIAGGAALAVAKKLGLLGVLLAFGKKAIALLIAGAAALFAALRRMFGARKNEETAGAGPS